MYERFLVFYYIYEKQKYVKTIKLGVSIVKPIVVSCQLSHTHTHTQTRTQTYIYTNILYFLIIFLINRDGEHFGTHI